MIFDLQLAIGGKRATSIVSPLAMIGIALVIGEQFRHNQSAPYRRH